MASPYVYRCRLVRVVDGDTLDVDIDLGFGLTQRQRVRVYGVNTPERGQWGWQEATDFTRAWCAMADETHVGADGWPLLIRTVKPHEKYGRWLADLQSAEPDMASLSSALISSGLAVPLVY